VVVSALGLLPWQGEVLVEALGQWRSSAVVVHGEPGSGQLELAFAAAKAWLCEGAGRSAPGAVPQPACGECPSCHLIEAGYHPDFKLVLPEVMWPLVGWDHLAVGSDGDGESKSESKKRKPSTEIKVEAIRDVVNFSQSTVSRGRAKVVLIHPAERLNTVAANTLLKTLEDPPGHVRFVLSCGALDELLPTVRSRCQAWHLPLPQGPEVLAWLQAQAGDMPAADAQLLLDAAGGRPQAALDLLQLGWTAVLWRGLCTQVRQGQTGAWATWPLPQLTQTLQKLCHDLSCMATGASPRVVPAEALGQRGDLNRLTAWAQELRQVQRQSNHPWSGPLKVEALLFQAKRHTQLG
jgi:DNA polymerase-3 subunit delta'